ncbi:MAG: 4-alpha-glucanotransferase [Nevskiaceae bacterium]
MRLPRSSGVLLHPTSLPGPHGSGDLGAAARHFIDWLAVAGQRLWQVLPLGGVGPGNSPYMSDSAFAGNPLLVDLQSLQQRGWLREDELAPIAAFSAQRVDYASVIPWRLQRLQRAAERFFERADAVARAQYDEFCEHEAEWLDDYALFKALEAAASGRSWQQWPEKLAHREAAALHRARRHYADQERVHRFVQWCFFSQWQSVRDHARSRGVRLVGDAPIFVAAQSADVWAHPELFELDAKGWPYAVAGVPPDYFSVTGQRWGNPLYVWPVHAREKYAWWIARIRHAMRSFDVLRIDHFRGFAAYWRVPAESPTAVDGEWMEGPGNALFDAVAEALGPVPIIAEDLGLLTEDVIALRRHCGFPGMKVLGFAWDGDANNVMLPHRYTPDTVVYTGTHDNDTICGWWASCDETIRRQVREYLQVEGREIHWDFIRAACASVADTAIQPLQDVLGLGSEHRMNTPGIGEGCWQWRFTWSQMGPEPAERLAALARTYGRIAP